MEHCNWCDPLYTVCGTCRKFFDYFGDGYDQCSANYNDTDLCVGYDPINYCPNCGRKLRTEDGITES